MNAGLNGRFVLIMPSSPTSVLAELRVRNENLGAPVAIEKLNWRGVKQGVLAPSTIILAFIFGFNNVTVQYVILFFDMYSQGVQERC